MKHKSKNFLPLACLFVFLGIVTSGCSKPEQYTQEPDEESDEMSSPASSSGEGESQKSASDTQVIMLPGEVPLEMVRIPSGSFIMGSPDDEQHRISNEGPQNEITIVDSFWIGKYPITQAQWQATSGYNPSCFKGDNRPVEQVSWNDICGAGGFLEKINEASPGHYFRLPSRAEWEYAYRADTTTRFFWGDDPAYTKINDYAWYSENSGGETHEVGTKLPNPWGLYDMAGNVWEWCEDCWLDTNHGAPNDDFSWETSTKGMNLLIRGGSWRANSSRCRAADCGSYNPEGRDRGLGFRIVCTVD